MNLAAKRGTVIPCSGHRGSHGVRLARGAAACVARGAGIRRAD